MIVLAPIAIFLRIASAALCRPSQAAFVQAVGWLGTVTSVWIGVGLFGGWPAWWPASIVAAAGMLLSRRIDPHWNRPLVDFSCSLTLILGSLSIVEARIAAFGVVAIVLAGVVLDRIVPELPTRAAAAAAVLLAALFVPIFLNFEFGCKPISPGTRIDLGSGIVGWLKYPGDGDVDSGALLFHGANPAGTAQRSAEALRLALLKAGFAVLSVDHPGFGESAGPSETDIVDDWNPLPAATAAFDFLSEQPRIESVVAFGHSQGAGDVLRLMEARTDLAGAVLIGAGLRDQSRHNEYWYQRFQSDRRLQFAMSRQRFQEISDRYYDNEMLARSLVSAQNPPVLFMIFDNEHANISSTREKLYSFLPEPKSVLFLENSDHYFNTSGVSGYFVCGDTSVTAQLALKIEEFKKIADRGGRSSASVNSTRRCFKAP